MKPPVVRRQAPCAGSAFTRHSAATTTGCFAGPHWPRPFRTWLRVLGTSAGTGRDHSGYDWAAFRQMWQRRGSKRHFPSLRRTHAPVLGPARWIQISVRAPLAGTGSIAFRTNFVKRLGSTPPYLDDRGQIRCSRPAERAARTGNSRGAGRSGQRMGTVDVGIAWHRRFVTATAYCFGPLSRRPSSPRVMSS